MINIPLTLYIHIPWCIRKCPYCDFNSHAIKQQHLPEEQYINALIADLQQDLPKIANRQIQSIFFGGGTPSLFSAAALEKLLLALNNHLNLKPALEITLEANPGTFEQQRFHDFRTIGINRLSIGIQSFNDEKLKILGRIHNKDEASNAVNIAKQAGFDNFNLDLMFGLPNQTIPEALADLKTALALQPTHLSWYQLTLEPNTLFYKQKPPLPVDDTIWEMQQQGQILLQQANLQQYETSAYSLADKQCQHNLNYWQFGDYLGIGAGAHSKITTTNGILRLAKIRHPHDYLNPDKNFIAEKKIVIQEELPLEFMMNALRLTGKIPLQWFYQRTALSISSIEEKLKKAITLDLLLWDNEFIEVTTKGKLFLNNLLELFLR